MKLKVDWITYLHHLRRREINIIFKKCLDESFANALELGAGDGFQSQLLAQYTQKLLSTDCNADRLLAEDQGKVSYKVCDAEYIDEYCKGEKFDLIFSSNLMEHIQHREIVLKKFQSILKDEGVMVHVMPSCFLKLCWMFLFHFNLFIEFLEVITKSGGFQKIYRKLLKKPRIKKEVKKSFDRHTNNPNSVSRNSMQRYVWPSPHGEYGSHREEFWKYRKNYWIKLIEDQGFDVVKVLKMPVVSGYGFGFNGIRWALEKLGFSSSYAYVVFKWGMASPYRKYWNKK